MTQSVCFRSTSGRITADFYSAMRRVLHLKLVTQCAMLEEFGLFLVLADKACFFFFKRASY